MQGGSEAGGGFQREKIFVSIGVSSWGEIVLAMLKHCAGEVGSEAAMLGPKIEEDSIRFPVAKGADCRWECAGQMGY